MNKCWCLILFYSLAGILGIGFYFIPSEAVTASVVVYLVCQAFMIGNFYLVIAYTPDLFSTDTRNFAFSFLDAISKVTELIYVQMVLIIMALCNLISHYNLKNGS